MTTARPGRVIVTGGSSGIGEATALHLTQLGFSVFVGVRRQEDADRMRDCGLTPLFLDVTQPKQLSSARRVFSDQPLAGLVNNAGITRGGPLEFVPVEDIREQFEVNVIGQLAVTQTFIDALRAGRGRIVNVGSIQGRLATPITGPYGASKFALEAITDTLRRELIPQGIDVIIVEPGGVKTPMMAKTTRWIDRVYRDGPPELTRYYGDMIAGALKSTNKIEQHTGIDANKVARVIGKALTARRPRTRYLVGRDAIASATLARLLPDRMLDRLILRQMLNSE
jgi:NAD(P)-dependent dehydrogenase (short-subunit alcohol dehydrogenase family)